MKNQRNDLFTQYAEIHGDLVDGDGADAGIRLEFFRNLAASSYLKHLSSADARVLEVGCGKGYFLQVLVENGFQNITGIDLSPANIAACKARFGLTQVHVADAVPFLRKHRGRFDVIFLKDVLEHVEKSNLSAFVESLKRGLAPGGRLIVQVPNMHWAAGLHERYMDLTHEIGFTRESLGQLMRLHFTDVRVEKVDGVFAKTWKQKILYRWIRPVYVRFHRFELQIISEGAGETWFDCREILAVCRKTE